MKETKIFYETQILQGVEGEQEWVSIYGFFPEVESAVDLFNDFSDKHPNERFRVVKLEVVTTVKKILKETPWQK